jgi:hypothetical protein
VPEHARRARLRHFRRLEALRDSVAPTVKALVQALIPSLIRRLRNSSPRRAPTLSPLLVRRFNSGPWRTWPATWRRQGVAQNVAPTRAQELATQSKVDEHYATPGRRLP